MNKNKNDIIEKRLGIPPDYQYNALQSKNYIHSNWYKTKLDAIEKLLNVKKTNRILDIGPGSGNFEFMFAKKVKEIVAIDYNDEAVDFLKRKIKEKKIKNVKVQVGDVRKLGKVQRKFDIIIMVDVIEHLNDKEAKKVIKSFKNILTRTGKVCIVTPNFKSGWVLLEWMLDAFRLAPELSGKQHLSKFEPKTLVKTFEDAKYKIDTFVSFNFLSFLIPHERLAKSCNRYEMNSKFTYGNLIAIVASKSRS